MRIDRNCVSIVSDAFQGKGFSPGESHPGEAVFSGEGQSLPGPLAG